MEGEKPTAMLNKYTRLITRIKKINQFNFNELGCFDRELWQLICSQHLSFVMNHRATQFAVITVDKPIDRTIVESSGALEIIPSHVNVINDVINGFCIFIMPSLIWQKWIMLFCHLSLLTITH